MINIADSTVVQDTHADHEWTLGTKSVPFRLSGCKLEKDW